MGLMRRAIVHGIEASNDQERPATGGGTDADDYIMDFDINPLSETAEQKLRLTLAGGGSLPLGHPHPHHQQQNGPPPNGGGGNGGNGGMTAPPPPHSHHAHPQQIINGNPHIMEEQGPRGEGNGGGGGGGHHPGMAIFSNLSLSRQHILHVKTLPTTPPATPPEGSPTQYHTGSPHFQRVPPIGGHGGQCDHDGGRGNVVEEIGMWNQGGLAPEGYNMNHEPIPINLSQNCPAGIESMWMPKPEHHVIHGGVVSPQPYIPHAHGHGPPHHAHIHNHPHNHPLHHPRSHTRSHSLESRDGSNYSNNEGNNGPAIRINDPLAIPDEVLTSKPVRDLNKLLHGFPRETIVKLKQKRRTLKNRGYAQNCRTKRLTQKNLLEETNKRLKEDILRLTQDRDAWKAKANELHRRFQHHLDLAAAANNGNNISAVAAAVAVAAAGNNQHGPLHQHNRSANHSNNGLSAAHLHHNNGQLAANQQQHPLPSINVPVTTANNQAGNNGSTGGNVPPNGRLESGIYSAETSTNSSPDSTYY